MNVMSRTWLYAPLAIALVLFGVAGVLSIGMPFLLTGLVMLSLLPWRRRRDILWPSLASVWGLTLGYLLMTPPPLLPALLVGVVVGVAVCLAVKALLARPVTTPSDRRTDNESHTR
jgi:hypothetical protein